VPILKPPPKQSRNESLQLRVSAEFKYKLQRYAQFLEATPSYVVTEALNRIFDKDHEFKTWLEQHTGITREAQIEVNSTMRKSGKRKCPIMPNSVRARTQRRLHGSMACASQQMQTRKMPFLKEPRKAQNKSN